MHAVQLIHAFVGGSSADWWSYEVPTTDDNELDVTDDCGQVRILLAG